MREVEAAVRLALKEYEKQARRCVDVSLPHSPYALAAYYIVAPAEAIEQPRPLRRHALRPPHEAERPT